MISLTPRQQDTLRYIAGHIEAKGMAPTYDEIAAGIGSPARSGAFRLVTELEERGALFRGNWARSIALAGPVTVPRAPDGSPLFFVKIGGIK